MTFITRSALAALATAILSPLANAQTAPVPLKVGGVTVNGSLRSRMYAWDWFEPATGDNAYQYSGNLLRIGFSQNRDSWEWNAEFAIPFLLGVPSNAMGSGPQQGALGLGANYASANDSHRSAVMIFPKQLYLRWNAFAGRRAHSLQVGRFEFIDGGEVAPKDATLAALKRDRVAQRLIGPFGFSDVGRSFDGFRYAYTTAANNVTVMAAVPTRGVFQVDGWGWNRIALAYSSYTRQWGRGRHRADTRLFFIEYHDYRQILKTDNGSLAARRANTGNIGIQTFGGHSLHAFETGGGTFDVVLWSAVQTGRWGAQAHRAVAGDIEAGFQPKAPTKLKPWIRAGLTYASGDGNPDDSQHRTFFQLLPTPRPYARFPFFNMMNMEDRYGIVILRPHSKITASSEFHALRLSNASDLWYSGGGAFQPWTFGYSGRATSGRRSLANLYDFGIDYRAHRKLTLSGYFGYAQGLAAMQQIYPRGNDGRFGYVEVLHRF